MTLNREKRGHFNRLRAASHAEADLAMLKLLAPKHELIGTPSGKDQKYADDVLYALLNYTTDCDIVAFRRKFAKEKIQKVQSDTLKQRFEEYLKKSDPKKAVDIQEFLKIISAGLFLLVAAIDWPVDEDVFPSEIELISVDNEKHEIRLTPEAVAARETAAKLKKEQEEAEAAAKLDKTTQLQEKEEELDEKESDLEDKELELSQKEDQLAEKEAQLAVKEADLKELAVTEKKSSVSKKKNTPK